MKGSSHIHSVVVGCRSVIFPGSLSATSLLRHPTRSSNAWQQSQREIMMTIHSAHPSLLSRACGRKHIRHMKYCQYKEMEKCKAQIYVSKEYFLTPALITMKLKCLMQKILSTFLQEKENRWKNMNQLRGRNLFIYASRDHRIQRIEVPGLRWNMRLHISRLYEHKISQISKIECYSCGNGHAVLYPNQHTRS